MRGILLAQRARKVTRQRGADPGIVRERRRQQLLVQPDLRVRKQDCAFGTGHPEALDAPCREFLVVRKKFELPVQAALFFEVLDEALLRVEQLWSDAPGHRKRLRLEI